MARPIVTIAVPLLNEVSHLPLLLDAIEAQNYTSDCLQIFLIDGGSEDGTVELASRVVGNNDSIEVIGHPLPSSIPPSTEGSSDEISSTKPPSDVGGGLEGGERLPIELVHNHARLAAAALNLALSKARGRYFMRFDARSRPDPDYIAQAVKRLDEEGCAGVAGVQIAVGESRAGRIHALALNHLLGVGGAHYRNASRLQESETLYLGAYPTAWLQRVGGWDEKFAANEDFELNTRIHEAGGSLLVDTGIHITYVARDSLTGLAKQYARYGAWRTVTWRQHHNAMRLRHLAPALFTAGLILGFGLLPWSIWPLATILAPYVIAIFSVSFYLSLSSHLSYLPRLLVVFPTLHLSWGFAFWLAWMFPPTNTRSPKA